MKILYRNLMARHTAARKRAEQAMRNSDATQRHDYEMNRLVGGDYFANLHAIEAAAKERRQRINEEYLAEVAELHRLGWMRR